MKQHKLSVGKRITKPLLFGTLLVGLSTLFINRHRFFEDVGELGTLERAHHAKRMEILERRQKQIEELAEKKKATGSD